MQLSGRSGSAGALAGGAEATGAKRLPLAAAVAFVARRGVVAVVVVKRLPLLLDALGVGVIPAGAKRLPFPAAAAAAVLPKEGDGVKRLVAAGAAAAVSVTGADVGAGAFSSMARLSLPLSCINDTLLHHKELLWPRMHHKDGSTTCKVIQQNSMKQSRLHNNMQLAWSTTLDAMLLASCDLFVGKFTSSLFRLSYELHAAECDCAAPFISLDSPWCYGWMEMVTPHGGGLPRSC